MTALPITSRLTRTARVDVVDDRRARMTPVIWPRYAVALAAAAALPPILGRMGVLNDSRALTLGVAATFAIAGMSLNLLMGYAGQLSLGHFALLGTGAFISSRLTAPTESHPQALPFVVGIAAAMIASAAVAFLIGLPALRLRGLYLAVVTVVFNFVMVQSLFQSSWLTSGSGGVELPRPLFGSFEFLRNADYLAVMLAFLVVVWLLDANLTSSKLGRALQAIRADETMAASFGVDVTRHKMIAFTLSGALAGLAGALYGHLFTFVNSGTFQLDQSLLLLTVVVLGGLGSRTGIAVIAAVYGILNTFIADVFSTDAAGWIVVASAALLMLTVSHQPEGLAGLWRDARDKKRGGSVHGVLDDEEIVPRLPDLPRPTGLPPRPAASGSGPLLEVRDIYVHFGGLVAVDHASLQVTRGKIVGLIGPNGAGKTTLFNAVSGALKPDSGRVRLLGHDLTEAPAHVRAAAGIGRTFQLIGLAKDLSVTENLLLAQHQVAGYSTVWGLAGLGPAPRIEEELRTRAWEAVVALGFERYADTPVKRLSHGQQRIVEIGCALVTAPELVMLDEPSAGMAPGAVENLAVRLRDMRDELGRAVLLIEHNIPLVLDVCDELYVMANGSIIAHGDPDSVVQDAAVVEAYLGGAM
jgi:ABC-type branched-subunit amino acid transport system ATPase component/ABC-type branched-subunit amino acid transport system permease subunit